MNYLLQKLLSNITIAYLGISCWGMLVCGQLQGQTVNDSLYARVETMQVDNLLTPQQKLKKLYSLKDQADQTKRIKDSSYAHLLSAISGREISVDKDYNTAFQLSKEALQIDLQKHIGSPDGAISSTLDLAGFYENLEFSNNAVAYFDTTIQLCKRFNREPENLLYAKSRKAFIFFQMGDYQKSIEESFEGLQLALQYKDTTDYYVFLAQKAQSHFYLDQLNEAAKEAEAILRTASVKDHAFQLASAYKIMAMIAEKHKETGQAEALFKKAIDLRKKTDYYGQMANDYVDCGNLYLNTLHDLKSAIRCYDSVVKYAGLINDSITISKAYINISYAWLDNNDYQNSVHFAAKAVQYLDLGDSKDILQNPTFQQLNLIGIKDPVVTLLDNKTLLLLRLFKKTGSKKYLDACIQTAYLTDKLITQMRYAQSGDQSKLYWRNKTRDFFANAIEACYQAGDVKSAFFFMERSRAVLLNDKLNELGALLKLPEEDANTEKNFRINIAIAEQKLSGLDIRSSAYGDQLLKLVKLRDDNQHFNASLETKYPAYYNYKYSDRVPDLADLQTYLRANNSSFVHYFTTDSLVFILSITANQAHITRLVQNDFNNDRVATFLQHCSNRGWLNRTTNYQSFIRSSYQLYQKIFQPLNLPRGRVIICTDNFLLPFEALCTDPGNERFLIYDYIFSYAYSATYLLKPTMQVPARGNFIGFAPVTFLKSLDVPDLRNSEKALENSAANYASSLLFTHDAATRNNFINNITTYTVANIFSHASGSSDGHSPQLYMGDSLIFLSDLQRLAQPATQLVILSACQTNVGNYAAGEGIYSLARGFSAVGIPAVSATLWEADENMIYQISTRFNEYLSRGMSKDSALQKAKLEFIQNNLHTEKSLPYNWANIILIGNASPLQLTVEKSYTGWMIGGAAALLGIVAVVLFGRKRR